MRIASAVLLRSTRHTAHASQAEKHHRKYWVKLAFMALRHAAQIAKLHMHWASRRETGLSKKYLARWKSSFIQLLEMQSIDVLRIQVCMCVCARARACVG